MNWIFIILKVREKKTATLFIITKAYIKASKYPCESWIEAMLHTPPQEPVQANHHVHLNKIRSNQIPNKDLVTKT